MNKRREGKNIMMRKKTMKEKRREATLIVKDSSPPLTSSSTASFWSPHGNWRENEERTSLPQGLKREKKIACKTRNFSSCPLFSVYKKKDFVLRLFPQNLKFLNGLCRPSCSCLLSSPGTFCSLNSLSCVAWTLIFCFILKRCPEWRKQGVTLIFFPFPSLGPSILLLHHFLRKMRKSSR